MLEKLETLPKTNCQTASASLETVASFTSERHFSPRPLHAAENVHHFCQVFKNYIVSFTNQNFELIPARRKQSFITKRGTRNVDVGTEMDFVWLQTQVNFPLSKEAPTMKIYRGEMAQVLVKPAPFLPSK